MAIRSLPGTRGRKRLYLMRHGEVSYHRPDGRTVFSNQVDLTEEGVAQAEAMAATLKEVEFDLAAHTGVLRTRRTAEIVLAGREIAAHTLPELIEIQGGSIEGMTEERLEAEFVYGLERAAMPGANFAGGETFVAFQDRNIGAMERGNYTSVHSRAECHALQFTQARSLSHRDGTYREYAEKNLTSCWWEDSLARSLAEVAATDQFQEPHPACFTEAHGLGAKRGAPLHDTYPEKLAIGGRVCVCPSSEDSH